MNDRETITSSIIDAMYKLGADKGNKVSWSMLRPLIPVDDKQIYRGMTRILSSGHMYSGYAFDNYYRNVTIYDKKGKAAAHIRIYITGQDTGYLSPEYVEHCELTDFTGTPAR